MPGKLEKILLDRRDFFNHLFRQQRHLHPHINGQLFSSFLKTYVQPLVQNADDGPKLTRMVEAIYQHVLILATKSWYGDSRIFVEKLWADILPNYLDLLLEQPEQHLRILGNALIKLPRKAQKRRWLELINNCTSVRTDQNQFKKLVAITLWMAGLSQYREAALTELTELDNDLCEALLLDLVTPSEDTTTIKRQLLQSPWLATECAQTQLMGRVGNSVLLGGDFEELPLITSYKNQLYVTSGEMCFLLKADAFGHAFVGVHEPELVHSIRAQSKPHPSTLFNELRRHEVTQIPTDLDTLSSIAVCTHTCAVSSQDSYQILLYARSTDAH